VPSPFLVLATQNPIESEGVYSLPEAQRDRFLMHVVVEHPSYEEETEIARRMSVHPPHADRVLTAGALLALQAAADGLGVAMGIRPYIDVDIAAGRLIAPFTLWTSSASPPSAPGL